MEERSKGQHTHTGMLSSSHLLASFLIKILLRSRIKKHTEGSLKSHYKDSKLIYKPQDSQWYIGKKSSFLAKAGGIYKDRVHFLACPLSPFQEWENILQYEG